MTEHDIALRESVAEIKGMLTATLARHDERLNAHDIRHDTAERRLNEKGKTLARHDERISDLEEDTVALKDDNSARASRSLALWSLFVAAGTLAYAIVKPLIG